MPTHARLHVSRMALLLVLAGGVAKARVQSITIGSSCSQLRSQTLSGSRERRTSIPTLLSLRGGAKVGPVTIGPLSIECGPRAFVYLNALAGVGYASSLIGLDPNLPDPTLKYWQQEVSPATRAILQFFALVLMWVNGFMIYAMVQLNAPATGLLKFQTFGWASVLALICFQANHFGFKAQQDTLGMQITLCALSAYLGFRP